ncbi:glycoside hydrolase family 13 protein [Propionispira raffinosivorans]|uniref:glycoside hydrolase family 13 protein n=1 Tax=Propionispira raffinosivorans TaxID=86959 RepID=UPI0003665B89|nr:alpha-glucosidase [Propionispira raffinosivorans]
MEKTWWKESVVYQIYPRSFYDSNGDGIGDLRGIYEKLDYLKDLGVDVLWLSPVYQSPNDDNGYDVSDYQAIMQDFGTMVDWDVLAKGIHDRGMKIVMDLVVNHSSDEHKWFIESASSKDNPKRDYYIWRSAKNGREPNNWESFFGGSAWQYDLKTDAYYLHLFSKKQPDLNWENPALRKEIYTIMNWWLAKGVDGFRMDVINFLSKVQSLPDASIVAGRAYQAGGQFFINGPRIHEFLQEMHANVLTNYDILTVGEMPGASVEDAILYTGQDRHELNMIFQFEHMDLDRADEDKWHSKPWNFLELKRIISKWQIGLADRGWNSLYLNNHDTPRMVSRFGNDKIYRVESAKMLATFNHMLQGTPYIYQGEELGMTNVKFSSIEDYRDIEILNMYQEKVIECGEDKEAVMEAIYRSGRDNARTPFQWNQEENAGFTKGKPWIGVNSNYKEINAEAAKRDENSIYYYYKQLIELRKTHEIIVYGSYRLLLENDGKIYAFMREFGKTRWLVVLNFFAHAVTFHLPEDISYTKAEFVIGNYKDDIQENIDRICLKPYEACVYNLL